jgi:hypothetical protein
MARFRLALFAITCMTVGACATDRALAPRVVSVDGATLRLEASLWRDFQPTSPPDGKPLIAGLRVLTVDGGPIPSTLRADSVWIYNGAAVWTASAAEEQTRSASASFFEVVARNGPKWSPGIEVDVVVQLRDAAGHPFLLQAPRALIGRTD